MPRIENSGTDVENWCESSGNASSTIDMCCGCAKDMENERFPYPAYNGDPIGVCSALESDSHPPYVECDYVCAICGDDLESCDD